MKRSNRSKQRGKTTPSDLNLLRQFYAEELRAVADLQSEAVVRAFAKVPREHFLGPGPWQLFSPGSEDYWTTKDANLSRLYHNVLVAIDASRKLNNGHPSFLAFLIGELQLQLGDHVVHIGCGTRLLHGDYRGSRRLQRTCCRNRGRSELALRARNNLNYFPNVEVIEGDGGEIDLGPVDAILVNAGATHPRSIWFDSLQSGGRLLVPLTVSNDIDCGGAGRILKVARQPEGFTASFISPVRIFPCVGGRDAELNQRLKEAFERDDWKSVQSLRRKPHEPANTCWLHAEDFCLSKLAVVES